MKSRLIEKNINIWDLDYHKEDVEIEIKELMNKEIHHFIDKFIPQYKLQWSISLPWPRIFEISINVTLGGGDGD